MIRSLLAAAVFCLVALQAQAVEVSLKGAITQGGVVFGRTLPGATVALDGTALRMTPDGRFVFGFGRDAAPTATLTVTAPDGSVETRTLKVAQRDYNIQRIDGLKKDYVSPSPEVLARIHADAEAAAKARTVDRGETDFDSGFIWPAEGPISGIYGSQRILNGEPRQPHFGVDIADPVGTPVKAPADGVVTLAVPDMYLSGGTLIVDHGFGLSSTFMHLSAFKVKLGQRVRQGEVIALTGKSGRVTGPHLHWGMNWYKERLDPALLVPPMPKTE